MSLATLTSRVRRAGFAVQTVERISPDDPIVTEPLKINKDLVTFARALPISELHLPENANRILAETAQPFIIHDPEWNTNRLWDLIVEDYPTVECP